MRLTDYQPRTCSICGSDAFEVLNRHTQEAPTRKGVFVFHVVDGICRECGFVYANPVPPESCLRDYYRSKYLYSAGSPDYDMGKRIAYLQKVRDFRRTILEVGSGDGSFLREVAKLGLTVSGLELNEGARETQEMPAKFEVVVANHVLEHAADPMVFLHHLRSSMTDDGILIIEVPNIRLYNAYSSAVFYEHLSHFSPENLAFLMAKAGFTVLEQEFQQVSRPVGFGVLARRSSRIQSGAAPREYEENRRNYLQAVSALLSREGRYKSFMQNVWMANQNLKIALWGANAVMLDLLKATAASDLGRIVAVDANPERWNTRLHPDYPVSISNPDSLRDLSVGTVVICAMGWEEAITQSLFEMGFRQEQIRIAPVAESGRCAGHELSV